MPAAVASSDVRGTVSIPISSHITNILASGKVRTCPADPASAYPYNANMSRRGIPTGHSPWYLVEWMAVKGMKGRGAQTKMMELTGWPKASMSQLYNGTQDYNPKLLAEASEALDIEPFELLMHPDRAEAFRELRKTAAVIVLNEPDPEPAKRQQQSDGTNG